MNSSQTPIKTTEIKTIKHLETVLKIKIEKIEHIIHNITTYYYEKKELKIDKNGNIKYKNGEAQYRIIHPSTGDLKKIQSNIHRKILSQIPLPINVKGGVKGNSNISNAKVHQGNKYKFLTDLEDFFPSISTDTIAKMFVRNGFSKKIASILSQLVTFNNKVPQGAPTSTSVANLIFIPIDNKLIEICESNKIKYTRYVDDLTFSSKYDFQKVCNLFINIINSGGFNISRKKTFYKSGVVEITGINVSNNTINIPNRIKDKLNILASHTINGEKSHAEISLNNYKKRVVEMKKIKVKKSHNPLPINELYGFYFNKKPF
jgi:RNA-directed DNA polymerase